MDIITRINMIRRKSTKETNDFECIGPGMFESRRKCIACGFSYSHDTRINSQANSDRMQHNCYNHLVSPIQQ